VKNSLPESIPILMIFSKNSSVLLQNQRGFSSSTLVVSASSKPLGTKILVYKLYPNIP
jgi:hypothetical protein